MNTNRTIAVAPEKPEMSAPAISPPNSSWEV
jgi:hypothetical protein